MKKNNLNPIKELVSPSALPSITETSSYPKPRWMLNKNVYDKTWLMSKVGIEISFFEENKKKCLKLNFEKELSVNNYLTDKENKHLLLDIQNTLLNMDVSGKITRPKRVIDITLSAINLIKHTNEIRHKKKKGAILCLEQIKFEDLKSYLLSFNVDRLTFISILNKILKTWNSSKDIDWDLLKNDSELTTREFASLKQKLSLFLKSEDLELQPMIAYIPEYQNAIHSEFDIDIDLLPCEKTISNEISKLEALYTARTAQKYKFQHSPIRAFANGKKIFDELKNPKKTLLMPIEISFHIISSALSYCRIYGKPLNEYIHALTTTESERVKELDIALSTSITYNPFIREYTFKNTKAPEALKDLNITSWEVISDTHCCYKELKNGISICTAVRLYTAAIWILLASFTASRTTSLLTLRRNCFKQSPVDSLFDLALKIPKSSERLELEEVYRPIPDLVYDYGLEFASLVCKLDERRGYIVDESQLFLFSRVLTSKSQSAARLDGSHICKYPLGNDYMKASIDMFQDWSNSPLINGRRWYPTTHQMREYLLSYILIFQTRKVLMNFHGSWGTLT